MKTQHITETEKILMERDGITLEEAREMIASCREEIEEGNPDAIMNVLGLEDDYIFDVIG